MKTYSGLMSVPSFQERFAYLELHGKSGDPTLGGYRPYVEDFYHTDEWKSFRRRMILRDDGNDLGDPNYPIHGRIILHHIVPIRKINLDRMDEMMMDQENLIICSYNTHQAIHYGNKQRLPEDYVQRSKYDTTPWRKV